MIPLEKLYKRYRKAAEAEERHAVSMSTFRKIIAPPMLDVATWYARPDATEPEQEVETLDEAGREIEVKLREYLVESADGFMANAEIREAAGIRMEDMNRCGLACTRLYGRSKVRWDGNRNLRGYGCAKKGQANVDPFA